MRSTFNKKNLIFNLNDLNKKINLKNYNIENENNNKKFKYKVTNIQILIFLFQIKKELFIFSILTKLRAGE